MGSGALWIRLQADETIAGQRGPRNPYYSRITSVGNNDPHFIIRAQETSSRENERVSFKKLQAQPRMAGTLSAEKCFQCKQITLPPCPLTD